MDVLELPRPVINFLRTMAKEGCRYVLSWDIFGGTDAVTLTLTWKLNEDQSPIEQVYDDLQIRHTDSPRRSRRDVNVSRPIRGKSLENYNPITTKPIVCHPSHVASLERSLMINRQKKESDPIYANLSHIKYNPNPSNTNSPLPIACSTSRPIKQQDDMPIIRKSTPTYSKLKRINHIAARNVDDDDDDDDDYDNNNTLDPWVKRLDYPPPEDNPIEKSPDDIDKTETSTTSGKVKFKGQPDYF